tara:strand:- start:67 stop:618 length:552 start_codon:yes stop_codon:yes gene_type:complete
MNNSIIEIPENKNCIICLKENLNDEILCSTNCTHIFCKECLDQWLDIGKRSCPLCRQNIQYFKNKDNNFRIIYQPNSTRNSRNSRNNNNLRLIRQNYNMKFILFSLLGLMLLVVVYYNLLFTDYNNLRNLYSNNENKLGLLRNELDICYSSGDSEISVIMIGPNNEGKRCLIQRTSYYRCFHE